MNTVNKYSVFRIILSTQIGDKKPYCYDGSRVDPSWLLGGLSKVSMCWLLVITEVCIAKFESHSEFWLLPPKESLCIQTFLSRSESPDLPFTLEVYETLYVEVYIYQNIYLKIILYKYIIYFIFCFNIQRLCLRGNNFPRKHFQIMVISLTKSIVTFRPDMFNTVTIIIFENCDV